MNFSKEKQILYKSMYNIARPEWAMYAFISDGRWYFSDRAPEFVKESDFIPAFLRISGIYQNFDNPVMIKEETDSLLELHFVDEMMESELQERVMAAKNSARSIIPGEVLNSSEWDAIAKRHVKTVWAGVQPDMFSRLEEPSTKEGT